MNGYTCLQRSTLNDRRSRFWNMSYQWCFGRHSKYLSAAYYILFINRMARTFHGSWFWLYCKERAWGLPFAVNANLKVSNETGNLIPTSDSWQLWEEFGVTPGAPVRKYWQDDWNCKIWVCRINGTVVMLRLLATHEP